MRFFASALTVSLSLLAAPLSAQDASRPKGPPEDRPAAARPAPRVTLDDLFERLGKADTEREADGIAALIGRRLARSGSDTADLLLNRATEAFEAKDYPLSIEILDRALALQPGWAEAWYRRAIVFYQLDDPVAAMADLHRALKIEPRHFEAWTGLGHIYLASDDKARALEAYRRALKINPKISTLEMVVTRLGHAVGGQDL